MFRCFQEKICNFVIVLFQLLYMTKVNEHEVCSVGSISMQNDLRPKIDTVVFADQQTLTHLPWYDLTPICIVAFVLNLT